MPGYRHLVYFWIAEYTDGTALPQFDPENGEENKFSQIQHEKLERFGWYPFSPGLAERILRKIGIVVIPSTNRAYVIDVDSGEELVAYRTNTIELHTKSGSVERGETTYILGIKGKTVFRIDERGVAS